MSLAKPVATRRRRHQKGAAVIIEFVLASLALTPLAIGTIAVGLGLTRFIQVGTVCRSAASMFVRGTDFTQAGAQRILGKIASGMGMSDSAGNILSNGRGVVVLSIVMRIGDPECLAAGFPVGHTGCVNRFKAVVTRRVVVGNPNLQNGATQTFTSSFGNPVGGSQTADGSYAASFYVTNTSAVAPSFGTAANNTAAVSGAPVHIAAGEVAYISEAFFTAPEINLFPAVLNISGYYQRNFF